MLTEHLADMIRQNYPNLSQHEKADLLRDLMQLETKRAQAEAYAARYNANTYANTIRMMADQFAVNAQMMPDGESREMLNGVKYDLMNMLPDLADRVKQINGEDDTQKT